MGFVCEKLVKGLPFKNHMKTRKKFARDCLASNHNWNLAIFTGEKNFSRDGSGNQMSYMDAHSKLTLKKHQQGGGSIMVWGMVLPNGFLYL
jgi:hypothetical protein